MHEITPARLRDMIGHYHAHEQLACQTKNDLLYILINAENMNRPIDAVKVLGLLRKAAADLRGLKAP